ncbi:MAG: hypothetical protein WA130_00120 [Candidatus Methanoperedens sp.]
MSDYKTSITDLYNQKLILAQHKEEKALLLEKLAVQDSIILRRKLQLIGIRIKQTQREINVSTSTLYADTLTDPLLQIEESNPLLLLPLRLETRFANSGTELWIRVYPDEISIHTHETALTASEIKAGSYYWRCLWESKTSHPDDFATQRKKAWSQVANRFGVNRATWIFLKTRPLKLKPDEDFSNILTETDLDPGPVEAKNQAWSEAAKSYVMPDLLKLRMYIAGKLVFETQGNPIVQPLPVSPDPKSTVSAPEDLKWEGTDIAWLEDFDKAVEVGMAFKINLSAIPNSKDGFSRIIVMGVRTLFDESPLVTPPPVAGARSLSTLFENHQYTPRGLALVSQGTPTNNTEEKKSGYSDQPAFSEERYKQDMQQASKSTDPDEMEDGKILAHALGLDPVLFQKLENSQNTDHRDAVSMNKALYPATLGFFLGHLLHPLFNPVELDTIRSFFCSYVTGRGPISVLRTGAQPYGILPTSNFKAFEWNASDKDYELFQKLTALLKELDAVYEAGIPNISKLGQQKKPHLLLDEILGLYPNSETFYQRVGYSEDYLRNYLSQLITVIPNNAIPNPLLEKLITKFSTYKGSAPEGILELKKIVLERTTLPLNRNRLVDVVTVSETKTISKPAPREANYIRWLYELYIRGPSPFMEIEKDYYDGIEIVPPLLYQLLKHGLLIQLYKCVFHWLSVERFLDPKLSIFHNGRSGSDFIASKEYLNFFQKQEDISPMELLLIVEPNLPFLAPDETVAAYFLRNEVDILKRIKNMHLFSWDKIPGNDNERLIEFLMQNFSIEWVIAAIISKTDDGKTIMVNSKTNFLSLILNDDKTKVKLEIDDGRTVKFIVKTENGELNIYRNILPPEILNDFEHLQEFFYTLEHHLADLSTARLERAMIEHLDCLTYRLDAWQTALFFKKLKLNRDTGLATGTVLGAYGWLENLKPAANVTLMQETDLPVELQTNTGMPIIKADDHGGYIHAPSLTQAKAAALLRNAYLHHHDPADPELMAVNLSSGRVRKALEIFEGIQKGHSTGELLGYRLERHLHDQATPLDKYIPVLRKKFPLGGKTLSNPESIDQPSTTQVNKPEDWVARLDGLAIVNAIKGKNDYPFGLKLPAPGHPDAEAIKKGIDDLLDCFDAMKDLMVAESIYQIVQGNTDRAGALLKSIHELKPPAKFESIRTPCTPAEILTHRACVFFKPGDFNNPSNPWRSVDMSQRAMTEPGLNEWLGEIIGSPDTYQCTVTGKKSGAPGIVTIEDLNLQPIDLVYLVPMQLDKEESELSRRIAYHYRKNQNIPDEIDIKIEYDKADKKNPSMSEVLPLLKLLKEVVTNSKSLDAADFDLQQYQGKANFRNLSVDVGSLLIRKNNLTTELELLRKKLEQVANTGIAAEMRECLIECCDFEIRDAFPKSAIGEGDKLMYLFSWDKIPGNDNGRLIEFLMQNFSIEWVIAAIISKTDDGMTIMVNGEKNFLSLKLNDDKTNMKLEIDDGRTVQFSVKTENGELNIYKLINELLIQTAEVISEMEKMLESVKNIKPNEEELVKSFTIFFGPAFKVLPVFHFGKNAEDEVERVVVVNDAYKANKSIFSFITRKTNISLDKLLQNWLNEVLYLRPKLASFELVRLLYNSFQEKPLGIHIMQLPYEAKDSWLGLEFPSDMKVGKGKLSMLIHHFPQNTNPDWRADFSGLLLDEWVEEIPGEEELTGISFQYNQPDSQPPQALLLAISPTIGNNWNWDKVSDIIDDTLRRAKQRAVGTGELAKTDWIGILPGVLAEFSDTKANVSLFFRN